MRLTVARLIKKEIVEIEGHLGSLTYQGGDTSTSSLESILEGPPGVLSRPPEILHILCASANLLPEKLTVYTTPVVLLTSGNDTFGGEFV